MLKFVLAAVFSIAFAAPVWAQEFYVVQDATTKKCKIVDKKPEAKTTIMVDNGVFKTKQEAKAARKKLAVCVK